MSEIYLFASTGTQGLFAFSGSPEGGRLPLKHGPWNLKRTIHAREALPHRIDRAATELAIKTQGCQLWRLRDKSRGVPPPSQTPPRGDTSSEAGGEAGEGTSAAAGRQSARR